MSRPSRPTVLMIGPTPPPFHGPSIFTRMIVDAAELQERYEFVHLDIADRRDLGNIGRLDLQNVRLALLHLWQLTGLCARHRPRIVHVQPSQNSLAFLRDAGFVFIARAFGGRVILHLHGEAFRHFWTGAPAPVRLVVRAVGRLAHRAWVLGEELRDVFADLVPAEAIRVVANGIPEETRSGIRRARAAVGNKAPDARPFRLLHLGQVARTKGVDTLIRVAERLIHSGRDVELVIAGDWGGAEDEREIGVLLADVTADSRVGDRIRRAGVVTGDAKTALLCSADAFLLLSRFPPGEGQPLAILEAMAAGVPVAASGRGAIPETLDRGQAGMVFDDPEDVAGIVEALATWVDDPALASQVGAHGADRFEGHYTEQACIRRFGEALDEALQGSEVER